MRPARALSAASTAVASRGPRRWRSRYGTSIRSPSATRSSCRAAMPRLGASSRRTRRPPLTAGVDAVRALIDERYQPRRVQRRLQRRRGRRANDHALSRARDPALPRRRARPARRHPLGAAGQGRVLAEHRAVSETPIGELEFLRKLQRLLAEGDFVATYKFALLNALADLSLEREPAADGSLRVPRERDRREVHRVLLAAGAPVSRARRHRVRAAPEHGPASRGDQRDRRRAGSARDAARRARREAALAHARHEGGGHDRRDAALEAPDRRRRARRVPLPRGGVRERTRSACCPACPRRSARSTVSCSTPCAARGCGRSRASPRTGR